MRFTRLTAIAVCFPLMAFAPAALAHGLDVEARWAPDIEKSTGSAAIYLKIANEAFHPEYLYRVTSSAASRVELHRMGPSGDMTTVGRMEIPFDDRLDMQQAGYHLMLIGLKQPIRPGDTIPLELTFSDDQVHQTNVTVPRDN